MSVIGIDIGNENSYIAVARSGGIETIANEYSQRSTPTYVAFGEKTRDLGVSAKNKQITNLQNTLYSFKRLIGRQYQDPVIQQELFFVPYQTIELPSKEVGFQVNYLQEQHVFTAPQVTAMMLTKLKEVSESNLKMKVQDCVLSVPVFYTDSERRSILDAAEIAGLNVLKLMNETTAVALAYGFYKQDLPEDKPKNVVFVDLGNAALQACACEFTKEKLKILGCSWHRNLGGRDFDNVLVRHFIEEFNEKYKLEIESNKRAIVRLMQECEKLKKQMSANSVELPINIECFMDDKDVAGRMKREDFEKLSLYPLQLIERALVKLLQDTRLKVEDIDSVQVVGGSSRLPAFKAIIQKVFGKEASTTLNQDEAVSRGCALQCAMLSPTCRVREFSITDIQPYPIKVVWNAQKAEDSEMEVFPVSHPVPYSKILTYYRCEPFTLDAFYADKNLNVGVLKIGSFTVLNVVPTPEGESNRVKIKARVNKDGVFNLCAPTMKQIISSNDQGANVQQTENTTNSPKKNKAKSEEVMESEEGPNGDINSEVNEESNKTKEEKESDQKKSKNVVKSIELPMKVEVSSFSRDKLNEFIEKESKMILQDKMEKERADAKNAVEEYVYEFRGKLSAELEEFVIEQEAESIRKTLEDTENWLYDEGEDQQKSVYIQKLHSLKKHGDPVTMRYEEWQNRPAVLQGFGATLQLIHKVLELYEVKDEEYNHISADDMLQVQKIWEDKDRWYGQYLLPLSKLQKHEDPPVTVAAIMKEKQDLETKVTPIIKKPKPVVQPPPSEVNGQHQTDSEMQDSNTSSEKTGKPDADSQPQSKSQPENMETN